MPRGRPPEPALVLTEREQVIVCRSFLCYTLPQEVHMQAFQSKKLKEILQNPEQTEELRKSIAAVTKTRGGVVAGGGGRFTISFKRDKNVSLPGENKK